MIRILIVEDDENISKMLAATLSIGDYEYDRCVDGEEAVQTIINGTYDLILLDVMLPGMDGFAVLEHIRGESCETPVIFLTALGAVADKVKGLRGGAEDYIVKPFNANEVMARVRAVLRRMARVEQKEEKKILSISNLTINIESYSVYVGAEKLPLTKKEVETMWILAENPSKVFTRDNLLDSLWGQDYFGDSRTVDSHIKRLRAKLDHPDWEIKTIWGLGYKLELNV